MAEVRGGLTLPWLWVSVLIAFLALGFMLPPLDRPLRDLARQSAEMKAKEKAPRQKEISPATEAKAEKTTTAVKEETPKVERSAPAKEGKGAKAAPSAQEPVVREREAATLPPAEFTWTPARPGITQAQIALGRAVTLPIEFILSGNVSKIKLSIPQKFDDMGVVLADDEVSVSGGKASSSVLFAIPPGKPLGKFELEITARDSATNREVGKGRIPFMLLPPGVGGC